MSDPTEILRRGVADGLHPGAQLCVIHRGQVVTDFACGTARPGEPMTTGSITQWYSAGKPLTAVATARLHEEGLLAIEAPVAEVIPEFAGNGKEAITFKHLLTHTAGFRGADKLPATLPWKEMIQAICETPPEAGWVPGEKAGYSTQAAWYILAEAIQRVTGEPFDEHLKRQWLDPLGMGDSWLRLPFAKYREYGARMSTMFDTRGGKAEPLPLQDAAGMAICRPGASARGPVRELARFYQMLLSGGNSGGRQFLREETVRWMTGRHRAGLYDHTFFHTLDFGLGFILGSNRYGANTVPYGYGLRSSDDAFGHSGAQSSCAFADPRFDLAAAWVATGQPGEREHQLRQRAVNTAIYESLGLGS